MLGLVLVCVSTHMDQEKGAARTLKYLLETVESSSDSQ